MQWALALLAVAVLGVAAIAASGRLGGLPAVVDDTPAPYLPDGELTAANLREVRFTVETRGYSMSQVDALLAQLSDQLVQNVEPAAHEDSFPGDNGSEAQSDRGSERQHYAEPAAHESPFTGDNGFDAESDRSSEWQL